MHTYLLIFSFAFSICLEVIVRESQNLEFLLADISVSSYPNAVAFSLCNQLQLKPGIVRYSL